MLELQNARERDLADWEALFAEADKRFVWKGGRQPRGSRLWILEWVWEGGGDGVGVAKDEEGKKGGEGGE